MIALLLCLFALMSPQSLQAPAQMGPAAARAAVAKPIIKPLTGHPLAGK